METKLSYIVMHESWYSVERGNAEKEIMIGLYGPFDNDETGGTDGEFAIRWHNLSGLNAPCARLEMFEDAWNCLGDPAMPLIIDWLRQHAKTNPAPADVVRALRDIGLHDRTERNRPRDMRTPEPDWTNEILSKVATGDLRGLLREETRRSAALMLKNMERA